MYYPAIADGKIEMSSWQRSEFPPSTSQAVAVEGVARFCLTVDLRANFHGIDWVVIRDHSSLEYSKPSRRFLEKAIATLVWTAKPQKLRNFMAVNKQRSLIPEFDRMRCVLWQRRTGGCARR